MSATHLITYFATVESDQQEMLQFDLDRSVEVDHVSKMNEVEKQVFTGYHTSATTKLSQ